MDIVSTGGISVVCEGQLLERLITDILVVEYISWAAQEAALEQTTGALAEGLFYINDIITSSQKPTKTI